MNSLGSENQPITEKEPGLGGKQGAAMRAKAFIESRLNPPDTAEIPPVIEMHFSPVAGDVIPAEWIGLAMWRWIVWRITSLVDGFIAAVAGTFVTAYEAITIYWITEGVYTSMDTWRESLYGAEEHDIIDQ